jgi:hypothetical protein
MGFVNLPAGGIVEANDIWRGYSDAADLLSIDWYNMTTDQAFGLFGIWTYPVITQRAVELSDGRIPAWGYVETTAQVPNEPTPTQVYRASWAHLIAGAQGIVFFDHRFADADVTQDFAAMLRSSRRSRRCCTPRRRTLSRRCRARGRWRRRSAGTRRGRRSRSTMRRG